MKEHSCFRHLYVLHNSYLFFAGFNRSPTVDSWDTGTIYANFASDNIIAITNQ